MRKLMLFLLLCLSTCAWAQGNEKNDTIVQYCLVMYNAKSEALVMDMHTNARYLIIDESGTRIVFDSSISLLNYMAAHGWQYKERFSDRNWSTSTMPCFLFKKIGKKEDEWFKGIKLEKL